MKKKILILFLLAIAIGYVMAFFPANDYISLDGVITDGEWQGAKEHDLAGGGKLMLRKENSNLYVALIARKEAWAHVYLSQGDTVRVMHASAALGEAKYVRQKNIWKPVQSFNWELRDKLYNDELESKQQAYFHRFDWVANNNNMGNGNVFEFKLDLSLMDKKPVPIAFVVAEVPEEFHYFPANLNDHTILKELVQGNTPDSLQFDPGSWEKIR